MFKGTVDIIANDPLFKEEVADSQRKLSNFSIVFEVEMRQSQETFFENIQFLRDNVGNLMYSSSDIDLRYRCEYNITL